MSCPIDCINKHVNASNILLVTSAGFVRRGVVKRTKEILSDRKLFVWDGVKPNPDLRVLDQVIEKFKDQNIDFVIGLGGGSSLDSAKVLAVMLAHKVANTLTNIYEFNEPSGLKTRLPLMVVPTTSGTGSEVTQFATIWDRDKRKKHSLTGDFVFPDVAVLDPQLTLSLGYSETLYPALDTLSHALESLWNKNKTPISEAFSLKALTLVNKALPKVLKEPELLSARRDMQLASTFAGLAISQTQTALAHSISYPLTANYGIPHGLACAFTLPRLIDYFLLHQPRYKYSSLMKETQKLLYSFRMDDKLYYYLSKEDLLSLVSEMYTPDRADNLSVKLPDLKSILGFKL